MQKTIRHQFNFNHPPEMVWEYLTKPELLAKWLMPNNFKLLPGHKFQFKAKPKINLGFDGTIHCEILEIIPNEKLSYSWKGGLSEKNPSLDSMVIWTLIATEGGTELSLEHKGFKGLRNYLPYMIMNKGWSKIGQRLINRINEN